MELEELQQHVQLRLLLAKASRSETVEESSSPLAVVDDERVLFHLTPMKGWDRHIRGMRCAARNVLRWKGHGPAPAAAPHRCWLLPTSDFAAVAIAQQQECLRSLGWTLLTCEADVVERLGNKALLRKHAEQTGLSHSMPEPYSSPDTARYPCILKAATGEFGQDCHIVHSVEEALEVTRDGFGTRWVLQELVVGRFEYSTSLLVRDGSILESIGTEYEYGSEAYVYPNVRKVGKAPHDVPAEHLAEMEAFLPGYSGICNFNYKVRPDGRICVFEINTRVGGDLAIDVPRQRARALFERLDSLEPETPTAGGASSSTCPPRSAPSSEVEAEPFVIEPRDGVHRYTLVYLHPFKSGCEDYVRKARFFSTDGLRIVFPRALKLEITCCGGRRMLSWYDYLSDSNGLREDELGEQSLAETRARLCALLDRERLRLREAGWPAEEAAERRLLLGGCSQGCGVALDVALNYPVQLGGFIGVVGHLLSATHLGRHREMPLHFFNGAKDKVMRWSWVKDSIDALRRAGYTKVTVHGPLPSVHHVISRQEEAAWLRSALESCVAEWRKP